MNIMNAQSVWPGHLKQTLYCTVQSLFINCSIMLLAMFEACIAGYGNIIVYYCNIVIL